jgi:hypothetical protein
LLSELGALMRIHNVHLGNSNIDIDVLFISFKQRPPVVLMEVLIF